MVAADLSRIMQDVTNALGAPPRRRRGPNGYWFWERPSHYSIAKDGTRTLVWTSEDQSCAPSSSRLEQSRPDRGSLTIPSYFDPVCNPASISYETCRLLTTLVLCSNAQLAMDYQLKFRSSRPTARAAFIWFHPLGIRPIDAISPSSSALRLSL